MWILSQQKHDFQRQTHTALSVRRKGWASRLHSC